MHRERQSIRFALPRPAVVSAICFCGGRGWADRYVRPAGLSAALTETVRASIIAIAAGGVPRDTASSLEGVFASCESTRETSRVARGPAAFKRVGNCSSADMGAREVGRINMHLLLWAEDSEAELRSEVGETFPGAAGSAAGHPGLLETEFAVEAGRRVPHLAFARQWLPNARPVGAESVRGWASALFEAVVGVLADDQPWALHVEPHYGRRAVHRIGARAWHSRVRQAGQGGARGWKAEEDMGGGRGAGCDTRAAEAEAGRHRCELVREALVELMRKKRRHLLRRLRRDVVPFTPGDSLVQLWLTAPDAGFLSLAAAPAPFEQRHLLSAFPKGAVAVAADKTAPSRAFAKLVEAETRLGRAIRAGETCVDLGASPGSWTYVAVRRGARVIAVDRSPLREDVARNGQVEYRRGDAFGFAPPRPADWLLCDVLAGPERTADLLLGWLRRGWCRYFVVTLKLKDRPGAGVLTRLKKELPLLTGELFLMRLSANKKEVCAFGTAAREEGAQ